MLAQEMHLGLDLGTQKLNSQFNKDIRSEEKDWFLNNEVIKFINQRTNPDSNNKRVGFQDTVKRLDDLRELVRTTNLPIQTDSNGGKYVVLPPYYFQYVRFDAFMYKDCVSPAPATTTETYYESDVLLNLPTGTFTDYTITANTPDGDRVLFDSSTLPTDYIIGNTLGEQRFVLIRAIRIKMREAIRTFFSESTVSLYWENADNNDALTKFNIQSTVNITSITVTINGSSTTTDLNTLTRTRYLKTSTPLVGNMRIIDAEFGRESLNSSLSQRNSRAPMAELISNRLYVYEPKSVVIGSVDITYISQPTVIDLSLNSNLNMSTKTAKEIVSNTVRFLKALIQDGNYEAYARENVLIE